jgi:hypothetical protein
MTIPKPPSADQDAPTNECIEYSNKTRLHISERSVGATFLNPKKLQLRKIHYDGCYCQAPRGRRADYILGWNAYVDVIVELKGSDLKRALTQVEATLTAWQAEEIKYPKTVCMIVFGSTFPRMTSRLGSMERDFLQTHHTLLWIRKSGAEKFKFRNLIGKADVS